MERARAYAADARAKSTRRAYQGDFGRYSSWCAAQGVSPTPPDPLRTAAYAAALADAGKRVSTIRRALAAIAVVSRAAGHDYPHAHPAITSTMAGIARKLGTAQRRKSPLEIELLREVLAQHRTGLMGARDRALLAVGFFAALRRSELAAVDVEHITFDDDGIKLLIPRSKTDSEGAGATIGIPTQGDGRVDPVRLLRAWLVELADAGVSSGPLFRRITQTGRLGDRRLDGGSIARIVKRIVSAAGLDAASFGGHSLRSGFVTSAARRHKPLDAIMRQTRHRSERVVLGYIRVANVLDETNAARGLA